MNLNIFMERGISGLMKTAARFYLKNSAGRTFINNVSPQIQKSAEVREKHEQAGIHVPPFLIASIASQCNLHCAGCYAQVEAICGESADTEDMSAKEWESIFSEAFSLGVSFILLAGGEPLLRRDVLETAAGFPGIIFPVFTNGTMMDKDYLSLFNRNSNLIPVLSLEGGKLETDRRRGDGTYVQVESVMRHFKGNKVLFGTSITVTHENLHTVTSDTFVSGLRDKGCGLILFVEYVPAKAGTEYLVLNRQDIDVLEEKTAFLKKKFDDTIVISFPGDEEAMGGCLASGRGFFHINARGGAEPCPFSPYSKHNLKTSSITEVLKSNYFDELREIAAKAGTHHGGCTLFDRREQVLALLNR